MSNTFFVSDIHISPFSVRRFKRFKSFVESVVGHNDKLYLLGDVFEYWIGPGHLKLSDYAEVLKLLTGLTQNGVKVYFLYGNRDYLVCNRFYLRTGVKVLGEYCGINLDGKRVFLTHGDFLYNKNPKYTIYRGLMDFSMVRLTYTSLPAKLSKVIATSFKGAAQKGGRRYYQLNREQIIEPTKRIFSMGYDILVCGHIHQPQKITFQNNGKDCDIYILGEWSDKCDYLKYNGVELQLCTFDG